MDLLVQNTSVRNKDSPSLMEEFLEFWITQDIVYAYWICMGYSLGM
jgi:hypothetical protein